MSHKHSLIESLAKQTWNVDERRPLGRLQTPHVFNKLICLTIHVSGISFTHQTHFL